MDPIVTTLLSTLILGAITGGVYFHSYSMKKSVYGINPTNKHRILIKDIYACGEPCNHRSNSETVRQAVKRHMVYRYFSTSLFGLAGFLFFILFMFYLSSKLKTNKNETPQNDISQSYSYPPYVQNYAQPYTQPYPVNQLGVYAPYGQYDVIG